MEPSDTPVSTVPHGVPMEGVKRREAGLRAECGALPVYLVVALLALLSAGHPHAGQAAASARGSENGQLQRRPARLHWRWGLGQHWS